MTHTAALAVALDRLDARLAEPAPVAVCRHDYDPSTVEIPLVHLAGTPASEDELEPLREMLGPAATLASVWERWNGLLLYAEAACPSRNLIALHAVGAIADETESLRAWLDDGDDLPDRDALESAIAIGGDDDEADCIVVVTRGERAGSIGRFDHETLSIEPIAADATAFVELLAGDPLELGRRLGTTGMDMQLVPVAYRRVETAG